MSKKSSKKEIFKEPEFSAFIAIDWADQKHDIAMQVVGEKHKKIRTIEHTPAALHEWVSQLRQQFGSGKIAVCLEQSKGPLINFSSTMICLLFTLSTQNHWRNSVKLSGPVRLKMIRLTLIFCWK